MKTITINDEVYRKLVALKGGRSFSEVIDELIRANVRKRAEMIIAISKGGVSPELEEAVRLVREEFKARLVEAPP
ncbi:MAG: antitoxin VapB family protein [Thermofilum sp.]|jgi:predicted CopG family antitoxin|nr:antitoxin VapB family protein [Thermofilum sp.]